MIKDILDILPLVESNIESIQIAKGKYKLAETFREGYNQIKRDLKYGKGRV